MIRVLVVDDHEVVRLGLAHLLGTAPDLVCVGTAADGAAAVEQVDRLDPDVVLMDLSMPGTDGVSALRTLRRTGRDVPVLVLSSFSDTDLVLEAVRAGANGYLVKDTPGEDILGAVRAVVAGGAPLDPTAARSLLTGMRGHPAADTLTDREREVLELVRQGHPNKSIARRLRISERTVKAHVTHVFQRIGVSDRTQAALWAERHLHPGSLPGR
ncbi:MAG: two component transcriptional regulator, LuxR family [Modestobacter sp.]|nr:two component transcriptional regulator, LuxR family [Modestobacter sp.]HEV7870857.1 response regulator transcription factor [Modestobacter sp.]